MAVFSDRMPLLVGEGSNNAAIVSQLSRGILISGFTLVTAVPALKAVGRHPSADPFFKFQPACLGISR